jgi:hypothetical protein
LVQFQKSGGSRRLVALSIGSSVKNYLLLPKADIDLCGANVCFGGKSGHQVQYAGRAMPANALNDLFLKSPGPFPVQD